MKNGIKTKRLMFFRKLAEYHQVSIEKNVKMALVIVNIDNFADIEQRSGFERSESYFKFVFTVVKKLATDSNCYRINDTQIALILPTIQHRNFLLIAANKILSSFDDDTVIDEETISIILSLGVSVNDYPEYGEQRVFQEANSSLAAAKMKGQAFVLDFEDRSSLKWPNLPEKIDAALAHNEMQLYYQPKINLHSNKIESAEALLRWEVEEGVFVPPPVVVEYVEGRLEKNFKFTKWVVNTALRQIQLWLNDDFECVISVNVSALLIDSQDIVNMLRDSLMLWNVPPHLLMLEVTETAMMTNINKTKEILDSIRSMGIKLSIDDFGTGYSSLANFKDIPAQELKIDRAFVKDILENDNDRVLVKLMLELSHNFGLKVVAEGVETKDTFDFLKDMGCDYIQGFYIAKPLKPENFSIFVKEF